MYAKASEVRKTINVTPQTLRRWADEGRISASRSPGGIRMYDLTDLESRLNVSSDVKANRKVCYCRVSSNKQKDDLERQKQYLREQYPHHEIIQDVGSGINFRRKGLRSILERANRKELEEVVVCHRDRLCRFGFELIEYTLKLNGVKILVEKSDFKTPTEELAEDLLSITTIFACRQMGRRRYKSSQNQDKTSKTSSKTQRSRLWVI